MKYERAREKDSIPPETRQCHHYFDPHYGNAPPQFLGKRSLVPPPESTLLHANYPNPFNPDTWIPYQLSEAAEVVIDIYDLSGHRVRRLALGMQQPGWYLSRESAAHWNGRNGVGEPVASGVYFYQMRLSNFQQTRRLVILK